MAKKKQHHDEHIDETWLLPYSDMMTLLLALFIVMFAMSKVDSQKLEKMSQQFNIIFSGGKGIVQNSGQGNKILVSTNDKDTSDSKNVQQVAEQDEMVKLRNQLQQEINNSGYADKVKIDLNADGLNITIQDTILFNSGDANILKSFDPILVKISGMIKELDNDIRISGHTDNVPISTKQFRDNWDLSYMRASNVMNFMVKSCSISPNKFSIQAYGEYKPKYDNSTEDGRSKNRNVEILIVRKYPLSSSSGN